MTVTIEALTQHNEAAAQQFVLQLLTELGGEEQQEDAYAQAITAFFNNPKSVVYVAKHENDYVGVMTAIESMAIYAQGTYGVIQELFVLPTARSLAVGQQLMTAMKEHAKHANWRRLEVTTPDPKDWARTVAFYEKNGFQQIGLRMKFVL